MQIPSKRLSPRRLARAAFGAKWSLPPQAARGCRDTESRAQAISLLEAARRGALGVLRAEDEPSRQLAPLRLRAFP